MKFLVRHETDGYVDIPSQLSTRAKGPENDDLSSMLESLSLDSNIGPSYPVPIDFKLIIKEVGKVVPIESAPELKTCVFHKPIHIEEVLPQLWVSQTPNLVRAYHKGGIFQYPLVENLTLEIQRWEKRISSGSQKAGHSNQGNNQSGEGKWQRRYCQIR